MCRYFEQPGKANTPETLNIAMARAKESGIKKMVVASTTGETALAALDAAKGRGLEVVVVGHQYGLREPDVNPMPEDVQAKVRAAGGRLVFATLPLSAAGRMTGCEGALMAANTLRMLCQGVKVCVEMAMMCADAGLVRSDEEVVCVAGTGRGADTACVIQPASTPFAWDRERGLKVREILCRPR